MSVLTLSGCVLYQRFRQSALKPRCVMMDITGRILMMESLHPKATAHVCLAVHYTNAGGATILVGPWNCAVWHPSS
jgi:hypothetical protein